MAAVLDFGSIISHLDERMQITIYTDGACDIHADNQPGGWAAILRAADASGAIVKETVLSGGAESTTNNQMELTAVIEGIKALKKPAEVTIFTDSRYVIDIARKAKGAKLNRALWQAFFDIAGPHQIDWRFVKGHAGDALNERCDRLAVAEKNRRAKPTGWTVCGFSADRRNSDHDIPVHQFPWQDEGDSLGGRHHSGR